eukprot:6468113-Amphidinium_carterae.1
MQVCYNQSSYAHAIAYFLVMNMERLLNLLEWYALPLAVRALGSLLPVLFVHMPSLEETGSRYYARNACK